MSDEDPKEFRFLWPTSRAGSKVMAGVLTFVGVLVFALDCTMKLSPHSRDYLEFFFTQPSAAAAIILLSVIKAFSVVFALYLLLNIARYLWYGGRRNEDTETTGQVGGQRERYPKTRPTMKSILQRVVLVVGALLVLGIGLYPPWERREQRFVYLAVFETQSWRTYTKSLGYSWIFQPPSIESGKIGKSRRLFASSPAIATSRLLVQWATVLITTCLACAALRENRSAPSRAQPYDGGPSG